MSTHAEPLYVGKALIQWGVPGAPRLVASDWASPQPCILSVRTMPSELGDIYSGLTTWSGRLSQGPHAPGQHYPARLSQRDITRVVAPTDGLRFESRVGPRQCFCSGITDFIPLPLLITIASQYQLSRFWPSSYPPPGDAPDGCSTRQDFAFKYVIDNFIGNRLVFIPIR